MIRILAALLLMTVSAAAAAEEGPAPLAPGEVLRGRFVEMRTMKGFDRPLKSEGRFTIAPGIGLIWRVEKPFSTVTVITKSGLTQTTGTTRTADLSARKMPFVAQLYDMIGGVLTGDVAAMEKQFAIERRQDGSGWRLKMVPKRRGDALMPFAEIRVRGARAVDEVAMLKADGDTDTLTFSAVAVSRSAPTPDERTDFGRAP
jgi:hypothetical protein